MKKIHALLLLWSLVAIAQQKPKEPGHVDENKFRQMYDLLATPNMYRTASGAPGPAYYQQQADYVMQLELDDKNARLDGFETITYHNNAKESLEYLWMQLDQNQIAPDSQSPLVQNEKMNPAQGVGGFSRQFLEEKFDGGFKIVSVTDAKGNPLKHTINHTMMRIDLPSPLKSGEKFVFKVKWWYNINDYQKTGGRSGYEYFPKDKNRLYVLAQFYPRMAVYNDVEGWQNMQFWGQGEFALPFGNFDVSITVPADHFMEATGELQNRKEVYTQAQLQRYEQAKKSYDKPVIIATQEEAIAREKGFSDQRKTWRFKAENVRDFGISTSRKFIADAMTVKIGGKDIMAVSIYPKEGNPLWEEYSTRAVAHTLKVYSRYTFDYPYPKAVSVNAQDQGMEYPMICWNFGRPDENGKYTDRVKYGMLGVIIHEVGHNFFPMIVNSDERQWTWMDEGLNTFLEYLAEIEWDPEFPVDRGPARMIVPYMSGAQSGLEPIMSNSEGIKQFGNNAYGKPATALNILREIIMGHELFDHAFKIYAQRWKFKHPTPEDFFRTMEDASGVDLDWYFRGWFYTTDYVDIGIKSVQQYFVTETPPAGYKAPEVNRRNRRFMQGPLVYMIPDADATPEMKKEFQSAQVKPLQEYLEANFSAEERAKLKTPKYFYEVQFEKPGGLVMPIILEITYEDNSKEIKKFPAQVWRMNDKEVSKIFATEKKIVKLQLDPNLDTADIDIANNKWPKEDSPSKFD